MLMQKPQSGIISGTADQLTRLARCTESEMERFLSEAEQHDLCEASRDSNGIVTIKNRDLLRKEKERKQTASRVVRHRQKTARPSVTVPVTEIQRGDVGDQRPDSTEQIEEKEDQNVPSDEPLEERQLGPFDNPEVKATIQAVGREVSAEGFVERFKMLMAGGSETTNARPANNSLKLPENDQKSMGTNANPEPAVRFYPQQPAPSQVRLPEPPNSSVDGSAPAAVAPKGVCPKCGVRPHPREEAQCNNRIPMWHKNCRPGR
jgi:hypothetical protein